MRQVVAGHEIKSNTGTVLTWGSFDLLSMSYTYHSWSRDQRWCWTAIFTCSNLTFDPVTQPIKKDPMSALCPILRPDTTTLVHVLYIFLIKVWSMDRVTLTNTQQVTHTSTALLTVLFPSPRAMLRSLHISKGAQAMQLATSHMVLKGPGSSPTAPSICWIILMTRKKVENNSQHQKSAWRTDKHS